MVNFQNAVLNAANSIRNTAFSIEAIKVSKERLERQQKVFEQKYKKQEELNRLAIEKKAAITNKSVAAARYKEAMAVKQELANKEYERTSEARIEQYKADIASGKRKYKIATEQKAKVNAKPKEGSKNAKV